MATADDVRTLSMALDGTVEVPHLDRRAFKVTRIYATLPADGLSVNLKLSPEEQHFKAMLAPDVFAPVPGGWGRMGWTTARLDGMTGAELADVLRTAWRHAAPRGRPRGKT